MLNRIVIYSFISIIILLVSSCRYNEAEVTVIGYKPIYSSLDSVYSIERQDTLPLVNLGKIYVKDNLLFVIEVNEGIHVFDNLNPNNPIKLCFIKVPFVQDIAMKQNILYVNNYTDLVGIDISDLNNIKVVSRVENLYDPSLFTDPLVSVDGYFECVDFSLGVPIRWEKTEIKNPKCSTRPF